MNSTSLTKISALHTAGGLPNVLMRSLWLIEPPRREISSRIVSAAWLLVADSMNENEQNKNNNNKRL